MYSTQISDNVVDEILVNYISTILNSHRATKYYQLENEKYDNFSENQILEFLSQNEEEKKFLSDQLNSNQSDFIWNNKFFENKLDVKFITRNNIVKEKFTHFRFSKPLITLNENLIIFKVVYQNNYDEKRLKGSQCIELFKKNDLNVWENFTNLFGMSLD